LTAWIELSEKNRQLALVHEFMNMRAAQADGKPAQEHLARLIRGAE
jgi:hypothetical protein